MNETKRDINGHVLSAGDFVELLETTESLLAGPYKYEGFVHGAHKWSVGGFQVLTSQITSDNIRLLDWKRWRMCSERLAAVLDWFLRKRERSSVRESTD